MCEPQTPVSLDRQNTDDKAEDISFDIGYCVIALVTKSKCTIANFSSSAIEHKHAKDLVSGILHRSIEHLVLDTCGISNAGLETLFAGLASCPSLKTLHIENTVMGDTSAMALAQMLQRNTSIINLVLTENCVGDEGWKAIVSSVVRHNFTLRHCAHDLQDQELATTLAFYLELNRAGRQVFRQRNVDSLWPYILGHVDDCSVFFYFLRENPGIFRNRTQTN